MLDHGYLEYIEHWGSDERIVEAARMSTNKGFTGWGPACKHCGAVQSSVGQSSVGLCGTSTTLQHEWIAGDEKLLRYLWTHKHATPFEMAGMIIEVQAPIMVFREWHRHRTQSYNEMSARYTPLPDVNYIPTVERLLKDGGKNRQAGVYGEAERLTEVTAAQFRDKLATSYEADERLYQWSLKTGVPKELARLHLPVGRYSRMRASANLRNWLAFLTLRMDANAQWEIQEYARAVGSLVEHYFPRTWELFVEGCRKEG